MVPTIHSMSLEALGPTRTQNFSGALRTRSASARGFCHYHLCCGKSWPPYPSSCLTPHSHVIRLRSCAGITWRPRTCPACEICI